MKHVEENLIEIKLLKKKRNQTINKGLSPDHILMDSLFIFLYLPVFYRNMYSFYNG